MSDSFADTVDKLAQQTRDIGYEYTRVEDVTPSPPTEPDSKEETADDESAEDPPEQYVILVDAAVGPDFVLFASEDRRYVEVQSSYPLWRDIADNINEDRAAELVSDELVEDIPDDHAIRDIVPPEEIEQADDLREQLAALKLLERADRDVRKEIVYQLSEIFTNAEVKHVVDSPSDTAGPHGFTIYYKIFPFEDGYSIRELNEVIERVRMAAHRGTLFLRYAFNLGVDISRTTAGDVKEEPTPPGSEADEDILETELENIGESS